MVLSTYDFHKLLQNMPISNAELARRSGVTEKTLARMIDGEKVQRHTAVRVLRALSELEGQEYTLDNVSGISLD
jgi:predicted transcriptional regulator